MDGKPQLLQSIDDPNGLNEDDWVHCIIPLLHQNDVLWTKITNFNGRYLVPEDQKTRLKILIETSGLSIRIPDPQESAMVLPAYDIEKKNQSSSRVYCNRGRSAFNRADYESAIKDFNTAFSLDAEAKCHAGVTAVEYLDKIAKIKLVIDKPLRCGRCGGPYHEATGHMFSDTVVACGPCAGRFWAWKLREKCGWRPLSVKGANRKANKERRRQEREGRILVRQLAERAQKAAEAKLEEKNVYPWPDGE